MTLEKPQDVAWLVFSINIHHDDCIKALAFCHHGQTNRDGALMPHIAVQPENLHLLHRSGEMIQALGCTHC